MIVADFQTRVAAWMLNCFSQKIAADRIERGDRLLEEVFELLQSGHYPRSRVQQLEQYVWGRPIGEPDQETGGVMVTLAAYCSAHDLDMQLAGEVELSRISTPEIIEKIRRKQASKPSMSPLPGAALQYDAMLKNAVSEEWGGFSILTGEIHSDRKQRFSDGTPVRTSKVVERRGNIVRTKNTTYLVEWAAGREPKAAPHV